MTVLEALVGFGLVVALLTVIPGLDTALVLRTALTRSRGAAFATAAGIQAGTIVWGIAAAVGATALLAASSIAFEVVRIAGAAYLVLMGALLLRASFRRSAADAQPDASVPGGAWRGAAMGLVTNLLNPKVGVFYLATIPQFIPDGLSPLVAGVLLEGVHTVLGMIWFSAIILFAGALGARLRRPAFTRWVDRVTGGVLVLFGVRLAADARL